MRIFTTSCKDGVAKVYANGILQSEWHASSITHYWHSAELGSTRRDAAKEKELIAMLRFECHGAVSGKMLDGRFRSSFVAESPSGLQELRPFPSARQLDVQKRPGSLQKLEDTKRKQANDLVFPKIHDLRGEPRGEYPDNHRLPNKSEQRRHNRAAAAAARTAPNGGSMRGPRPQRLPLPPLPPPRPPPPRPPPPLPPPRPAAAPPPFFPPM